MTTSTTVRSRSETKTGRPRSQSTKAQPARISEPAVTVRNDTIYVYLDNGQVAVVRNVSSMEMSDKTIRLLRDGRTIAEYRRSDVYCATRELISPPFSC